MSATDLNGIVHSDPEILGGTPVFVGTRVPLKNLIDALEGGDSIDDFLEGFPSVKRKQAVAIKAKNFIEPYRQYSFLIWFLYISLFFV